MTTETRTPPEFVEFVRDIGVRSFDDLSWRIQDERSPFHKLASYWNELEAEQKSRFFDQLITGAQALAASGSVSRPSGRSTARSGAASAGTGRKKHITEIDDKKEKKKNKKKADGKKVDVKKAKNKDKKGKKKKAKKAGAKSATPSAS